MTTSDLLEFLLSEPWFRIRAHVQEQPRELVESLLLEIRQCEHDHEVYDDQIAQLQDLADEIHEAIHPGMTWSELGDWLFILDDSDCEEEIAKAPLPLLQKVHLEYSKHPKTAYLAEWIEGLHGSDFWAGYPHN